METGVVRSTQTEAQAVATATALLDQEKTKRENAGPAGGLLIAVGSSLILWAVIAQAAKMLATFVL